MPKTVDHIHSALMDDPDFKPREGQTKDEAAWAVAWSRYKQSERNNLVLSMTKDGGYTSAIGPDVGESKVPSKHGPPSTAGKKEGEYEELDLKQNQAINTDRVPDTATERVKKQFTPSSSYEPPCAINDHRHPGIVGCHPKSQHHRFEHRGVMPGLRGEFTAPFPETEEMDEPEYHVTMPAIAEQYKISPKSLQEHMKRIYPHLQDELIRTTRWTAEGKELPYSYIQLRPSQIYTAHQLAREIREKSVHRSGKAYTVPREKVEKILKAFPWYKNEKGEVKENHPETSAISRFFTFLKENKVVKPEFFSKNFDSKANVSADPPKPGFCKNPITGRWVKRALGIRPTIDENNKLEDIPPPFSSGFSDRVGTG